jgi:hypothetical protein
MSLIKLASYRSSIIKDKYYDNRWHFRKHKGKYIGAAIGLPLFPIGSAIGAIAGAHLDNSRLEKDFHHMPNLFKKYKEIK